MVEGFLWVDLSVEKFCLLSLLMLSQQQNWIEEQNSFTYFSAQKKKSSPRESACPKILVRMIDLDVYGVVLATRHVKG